jgi:hypothetical protein
MPSANFITHKCKMTHLNRLETRTMSTTNGKPQPQSDRWVCEMKEVFRAAGDNFSTTTDGTLACHEILKKYGISAKTLTTMGAVFLPKPVSILEMEGENVPPFLVGRGQDTVVFGPGVLIPLRHATFPGLGALLITRDGSSRLIRGSRNFPMEFNVRPNLPLVITDRPLYGAALASRYPEEIGVMVLPIPRDPSAHEKERFEFTPCICIDETHREMKSHGDAWGCIHNRIFSFQMARPSDIKASAAELGQVVKKTLREVKNAKIPKLLDLRSELRSRILRLGGASLVVRKIYIPKEFEDASHDTRRIGDLNAVGFSGAIESKDPSPRYCAVATRDGICHVADLNEVYMEHMDFKYGPAILPTASGNCTTASDLLSLEGAASYLADRLVPYEELLREALGKELKERDFELILNATDSSPDLAAYRALVNNRLLNLLESFLKKTNKLSDYNLLTENESEDELPELQALFNAESKMSSN